MEDVSLKKKFEDYNFGELWRCTESETKSKDSQTEEKEDTDT